MNKEPQLHLNHFDGPLELLLNLIRKSKMSIYDIKITSITDQYIHYLKHSTTLDISVVGDFLVMAAKLMLIKSKVLLPHREKPNDHDSDEEDPRAGLVHQLVLYKEYKKAAKGLATLEANRQKVHTRPPVVPNYDNGLINDRQNRLNVSILKTAFQRVVQRKWVRQPVQEHITEWQYSVKDQSRWIIQTLDSSARLLDRFLDIYDDLEEIITNFLAILGLIKQQQIKLFRSGRFAMIEKRKK